jgi:hypothetical protein
MLASASVTEIWRLAASKPKLVRNPSGFIEAMSLLALSYALVVAKPRGVILAIGLLAASYPVCLDTTQAFDHRLQVTRR